MLLKKTLLPLAAAALLGANVANAGLLSIDLNGDSFEDSLPIGAAHDVALTKGATGFYQANLSATQDVTLTYEYLGFEAGWTNAFLVDDTEVFWNRSGTGFSASSVGDSATSSAGAGDILDFGFSILAGGNAGLGVDNGSNNSPFSDASDNYGLPNFFLGYADLAQNSVYIALDDGGGRPWTNTSLDDDNHDDLVIKVTAVAVPEPSILALMGAGLLGLGFARRRKQ